VRIRELLEGALLKDQKEQIIKQSFVFSSLDPADLSQLSALTRERKFAPGEFIFMEGDPSDSLFIISSGRVRVSKLASQGKEIVLGFFGPGDMVGEVAVFEGKAYPASALAAAEVRLLVIEKRDFLSFLATRPEVSLKIINVLSGRLRESQGRLRDLAGERVEQRLARIILMLSARLGPSLPFTRQELSDMAGTTAETAIRTLSQWKERGIISSVRGNLTIVDEKKLKLLAEGPPEV
jgi:CRP/FNR family transcriptional regulator, nitrogen oxide reductase regulator